MGFSPSGSWLLSIAPIIYHCHKLLYASWYRMSLTQLLNNVVEYAQQSALRPPSQDDGWRKSKPWIGFNLLRGRQAFIIFSARCDSMCPTLERSMNLDTVPEIMAHIFELTLNCLLNGRLRTVLSV